jgi:hypothetical protein
VVCIRLFWLLVPVMVWVLFLMDGGLIRCAILEFSLQGFKTRFNVFPIRCDWFLPKTGQSCGSRSA